MSYQKRFFIGFLLLIFVIALYLFNGRALLTLARLQEHRLYLQNLVEQHYLFSVAVYLLIFMTASALSVPITIVLTIAAGYFFGIVLGVFYANVGATVGAAISFLSFRYLFGQFVQKRYHDQLKWFNNVLERHGHNYLLTLQLLPVTPTAFINIGAGLTRIRFWTFVWTTSVGIAPGSLIYVIAGRQFAQIQSVQDLLSMPMILMLVLLALGALVPVLIQRYRS